jgi:hypothetical protein
MLPFHLSRENANLLDLCGDRELEVAFKESESGPGSPRHNGFHIAIYGLVFACISFFVTPTLAPASHHYTDKQMDALEARIGKTFWLNASEGRLPAFVNSPAANAAPLRPAEDDSFVITELTGRKAKNPYYAVKFESGKVGYIGPEQFFEALNVMILSSDPRADERERAEKKQGEEKARVEWINSQPWSGTVKEAAIRKQPVPGLKTNEVKRIMGAPLRVNKLRAPVKGLAEEHWFYPGGAVLIFHNGLLTKTDRVEAK